MTRVSSLSLLISLFCIQFGACADPSGGPQHGWVGDPNYEDASQSSDDGFDGQEPPPPPFSREFSALLPNEAQWSQVKAALVAARVERGMDESWNDDIGYLPIDPSQAYAELDITVTNLTPRDVELAPRQTWDLILPDGTRIQQTNMLAASLSPLGTASYTLRYAVDEAFDLAGTQLELNGPVRGTFQPERIPLDSPYRPDIDVHLTELEGVVLESSHPEARSQRRFEIRTARISRNSLIEQRAEYGKLFLELEGDVTAMAGSTRVTDESMHMDIDGKSTTASHPFSELIEEGNSASVHFIFSFPDNVRDLDVRMWVSIDDDDTEEFETIHVSFAP
jgi:hypothetical protein